MHALIYCRAGGFQSLTLWSSPQVKLGKGPSSLPLCYLLTLDDMNSPKTTVYLNASITRSHIFRLSYVISFTTNIRSVCPCGGPPPTLKTCSVEAGWYEHICVPWEDTLYISQSLPRCLYCGGSPCNICGCTLTAMWQSIEQINANKQSRLVSLQTNSSWSTTR